MTTTTTLPSIAKGEGTNPLKGLLGYGQSPWMDYVRRDLLASGRLKQYIDNDGLRGVAAGSEMLFADLDGVGGGAAGGEGGGDEAGDVSEDSVEAA